MHSVRNKFDGLQKKIKKRNGKKKEKSWATDGGRISDTPPFFKRKKRLGVNL